MEFIARNFPVFVVALASALLLFSCTVVVNRLFFVARNPKDAKIQRRFLVWVAGAVLSTLFFHFSLNGSAVMGIYNIPSESMVPTLKKGDVIVVDMKPLLSLLRKTPVERGDVVVFVDEENWYDMRDSNGRPTHVVKRVIGLPGDHVIGLANGDILVNGVTLSEPYVSDEAKDDAYAVEPPLQFDLIVPQGRLWVMGDNRPYSQDARWFQGRPGGGTIAQSSVKGVLRAVVLHTLSE